jgi:SNF2 family DNA or RNA helicase
MLVGNCAAMSHGLNLQSGGHRVIWFSLPVSQEIYDQAVARLWRSGQENAVIVHRLIANDSIDQKIAKLLDRKMLSQAALLRAVGC